MKEKRLTKLITLMVALNSSMALFAQNETVVVSKTIKDSIDYNYQRKYEYLNNNLLEEKSLFKIGARYTILLHDPFNYCILGVTLGYEKKLSPSFSLLGELRYYDSLDSISIGGLNLHGKYFFRKNKEINDQTSANNFFGSYIQFGIQDFLAYQHSDWRKANKRGNKITSLPVFNIAIGQQFYLTRWYYFDYNIYSNYSFETNKFNCGLEGTFHFVIRSKRVKY